MVGLSDDSNEGLPEDSIKEAIRAGLVTVNTCLPGTIVSFDSTKQTAVVQVSLKRNLNGVIQDVAQLADVPVKFARAGGFAMTFPVASGDRCELRFSQRSLANWSQESGSSVDPADTRLFDLSDAISDMGLYPEVQPLPAFNTTDMELRSEDGTIVFRIKPDGTFEFVNPLSQVRFNSTGLFEFVNPALTVSLRETGEVEFTALKYQFTGGADELMLILADFCDVVEQADVQVFGTPPLTPATRAAILAIKARIVAMTV